MKKTHFYMVMAVMIIFAAQSSAYVETWGYTQNTALSTVSPWLLGHLNDTVEVADAWATGPNISQMGGAADSAYYQQVDYSADLDDPIIRVETKMFLAGANSHAYVGLGDYSTNWADGDSAFSLHGLRFRFGIYDAAGTYTEDYNFDEYFHNKWWDIRLDIDPAANGGDGELDFYYKEATATTWSPSAALSGLNLYLSANAAIDDPETEWTGVYTRVSSSGEAWNLKAYLGETSITGVVPEPATMTLLGLGGMMLLKRRKKA